MDAVPIHPSAQCHPTLKDSGPSLSIRGPSDEMGSDPEHGNRDIKLENCLSFVKA